MVNTAMEGKSSQMWGATPDNEKNHTLHAKIVDEY